MRLIRGRHVAIFVSVFVAGAALLHVSQMVQNAEEKVARLERQIETHSNTIRVLNAEWVYLNSPERLESLSAQLLDLGAPDARSFYMQVQTLPAVMPMPGADMLRRKPGFQNVSLPAREAVSVLNSQSHLERSIVFDVVPRAKPARKKRAVAQRITPAKDNNFSSLLDRLESKSLSDGGAP